MDSYIGNSNCNDYRIGNNTVKALYKGDNLIWEKPSSGWDFTFRFNFNTKLWDSTTNTIPNKEGGLETNLFYIPNEGLQYIDIHPDYFDITGMSTSYRQLWDFGSWQNNPYVQNNSNCTGTMMFKVKHTGPSGTWGAYANVMGCRDGMNAYNWYTSCEENTHALGMGGATSVSYGGISGYTAPILAVSWSGGRSYGYSFDGSTLKAQSNNACSYNSYQSRYFFILVDNNDPAYCLSKFYWCFFSPEALTLDQIKAVIDYNENL